MNIPWRVDGRQNEQSDEPWPAKKAHVKAPAPRPISSFPMKSIKPVVPSKAAARAELDTISLTALHEDLQKLYPNIAKEKNKRFLYSIKAF